MFQAMHWLISVYVEGKKYHDRDPGSQVRMRTMMRCGERAKTIDSMKPASMKPDPWNWKDVWWISSFEIG